MQIFGSKHLQHTSRTDKTFLNKRLQHASGILAKCATSPIYFCNIHKKQLQHTFETTETPETYICNIGEEKPGPVYSNRWSQSWRRAAAHEHHQHPTPAARASTTTIIGLDSAW
jgi:hypothetical protein